MHQFFVPLEQIGDGQIEITGSDVHHIRHVLRMNVGDELGVLDGRGKRYLCRIDSFDESRNKERATAQILSAQEVEEELPAKIWLFQGIPKSDKMDLIVQKAVELGAYAVVPVEMQRSVSKPDEKQMKKKRERWQSIAEGAAKQAQRGIIPEVCQKMSFREALNFSKDFEHLLLPYELASGMDATRNAFAGIRPGDQVAVFIGPEGGFSLEEVEEAKNCGAKILSLGRRILRTETAGMAVLSMLMYLLEE